MRRSHYKIFDRDEKRGRFIVVFSINWDVIERQVIAPGMDLWQAMSTAIEGLRLQGWVAESAADWGFTFVRRDLERRLILITARDPCSTEKQSFSPFKE